MRHTYINAKDFTRFFIRDTGTVQYVPITGTNSGVMLDGTEREDIIRRKAHITRNCAPLTEAQAYSLLDELFWKETVELEYFDPRIRDYKTITAMVDVTPATEWEELPGGDYWAGITLTFRER